GEVDDSCRLYHALGKPVLSGRLPGNLLQEGDAHSQIISEDLLELADKLPGGELGVARRTYQVRFDAIDIRLYQLHLRQPRNGGQRALDQRHASNTRTVPTLHEIGNTSHHLVEHGQPSTAGTRSIVIDSGIT